MFEYKYRCKYKITYKSKYLTKLGKVECVLRVASAQVPPDPIHQLVNLLDVVSFLSSFCVFVFLLMNLLVRESAVK